MAGRGQQMKATATATVSQNFLNGKANAAVLVSADANR